MKTTSKGFTLIELMIVVAIIGFLAGVSTTPTYVTPSQIQSYVNQTSASTTNPSSTVTSGTTSTSPLLHLLRNLKFKVM